ncbi:MAG: cell surface protein SprA, partial [candidate division Zixibacteria bacterium]|nr:cell surface protein SprA [candidate division Zixibacteria bacterium]
MRHQKLVRSQRRSPVMWVVVCLAIVCSHASAWGIGISRDTVLYHPLYPHFDVTAEKEKYPVLTVGDLLSSPLSQEKFDEYFFGPDRDPRFTHLGRPLELQIGVQPLQVDLETFHAFKNQDRIIDAWNTDIQRLMKQSDAEKRGELKIGVELPSAMESIVGEGGAGLKVSGYRRILFSGRSQWTDAQSSASARQNKFPSLTMDQKSRFTIEGTVGSKVSVKVDQDSERQTDLENRIQIRYRGGEDDILQSVEAGNTTLSLPNTRYVGYSQRIQGLFGFKAEAQVGPIDFTMIASQEKGNTVRNRFTAGATGQTVSFRRDYQYARYRFFDIGRVGDETLLQNEDVVVRFELYELINTTEVTRGKGGVAFEDVTDPDGEAQVSPIRSRWEQLGQQGSEWVLVTEDPNRELPYVKFINQQSRIATKTIAYYMEVERGATRFSFGSISGDSLELQLLKRSNPSPDDPFWDAEWKNVYDLGLRNIDYNEFQLDIYKGQPGDESNLANKNHQEGAPYLQILGLDRTNQSGAAGADGKVDNNPAVLDLESGLLIFPDQRPFDTDVGYAPPGEFETVTLDEQVPAIYETDNYTELQKRTKYYFRLVSRSRSTNISLQQVNILPESEVITFNGRRLIKGSDYQVDYGIGQVTLLRDEYLDPTGELTIDYEYAPFLTAEKKSLFGMRGEYQPNNNFRTGATFLYKGSKATDRPAQLGQEPFRDIVLDYDIFWRTKPNLFTSFANALPLVRTEAPSNLSIEAEVARSMPNPNTKGEVYVDDFEGSRQAYSLGILRESWTIGSPPIDLDLLEAGVPEPKPTRGLYDPSFVWYNPYTQFKITDIYNREVENNSEDRTHVLVLRFDPRESPLYDSLTDNRREVWGGIMNGLPRGVWDQTRAELLEIRMAVLGVNDDGSFAESDSLLGTLHIDLGRISEDVNLDGQSNTEDVNRNGTLEDDEDVGLDGVPSSQEDVDGDGIPDTNFVTLPNGSQINDPLGDDWFFSDDYREFVDRINGTEGNSGDFLLGRPDKEDIGGEGENDLDNAYYAFEIDLANPGDKLVDGSEKPSQTGLPIVWKTYRIPLWELYDAVDVNGRPDSNNIQYVRLWIDNAGQRTECLIAALDIIQNRWEGQLSERPDLPPVHRYQPAGIEPEPDDSLNDKDHILDTKDSRLPRLAEPRFRVEVR